MRAHQGHLAVKAGGSVPTDQRMSDVAVDRRDRACWFLASLRLLFALRGYLGEGISYEASRLGYAGVQMAQAWDSRLAIGYSRKVGFFIQAVMSL
jgi:hypothetical protein